MNRDVFLLEILMKYFAVLPMKGEKFRDDGRVPRCVPPVISMTHMSKIPIPGHEFVGHDLLRELSFTLGGRISATYHPGSISCDSRPLVQKFMNIVEIVKDDRWIA